MRNRGFGVELEFDTNDIGIWGIGDLLWENGFREDWVGTRTEQNRNTPLLGGCTCQDCRGAREAREKLEEDVYHTYDGIGQDGSEIELRTPILSGQKGFNDLKRLIELLNKEGCYTTEADGLHVHHDCPEFVDNKSLIVSLLKSWKYNEHHIAQFIDENRASIAIDDDEYDESPCPTFTMNALRRFEEDTRTDLRFHGLGRANINITPLTSKGSIEFRFHEGTLNWDEIESWIRFGQSFINSVVKRQKPLMPAENPVILLNRLRTNGRAKVQLAKKAGIAV